VKAAQGASALAGATLPASKGKVNSAVAQLDEAITNAGTQVDTDYAYLTALDTRAGQTMLPAGSASGSTLTLQNGAVIYSISGANSTEKSYHLAVVIGVIGMFIGGGLGLSLYRIRRGEPSSIAPPKKAPKKA
jgi:hypothetical protein